MDNKRKILKDSIVRLLQLNISDREIIENLGGVGIDEQTAKDMLVETKAELSGKKPLEPGKSEGDEVVEQDDGKVEGIADVLEEQETDKIDDEIYTKIYSEIEEEKEPKSAQKKGKKFVFDTKQYSAQDIPDKDMAQLWEKGILATVDVKLNEMQHIKDNLDSAIESKINEKIALQSKKVETALESQRALFYNKIDAHLQEKADEMKKVVEAKAKQLEDVHAKLQQELVKIQGEKKFNLELLNSLNEKLTGLDTVKSQMISQTNSALIDMESKFKDIEQNADSIRIETEERVNRALQLEAKITGGLVEDLKQKIGSLRLQKEEELTLKIQSKLKELDDMTKQVDPKEITEKIAKLKDLEDQLNRRQKELDRHIDSRFEELKKDFGVYKKEVSAIQTGNLDELRKQYSADVDELFAKNLIEWDKKLKEKKKEIEEIKKEVDVEKFNATMESLDVFKQQFLNTVQRSIQDYNKSKKQLAESIISRDREINDYVKKIDAKMQELSEFEKKFSIDVADLLGKVPGEKIKKVKKK